MKNMMKATLVLIAFLVRTHVAAADMKITFDETNPGELPKGWEAGITGNGKAKWEVVTDDTAPSRPNVLKQSGEATFCWAAKTDVKIRDGFVEVKFKPVNGKEDQAGGIVWRFQDANNYYVVRGNALEDNVVVYKTVNGKRSSLQVKGRMFGYGVDTRVPTGRWTSLRIDFAGKLFSVSVNGSKLFEVEDETFKDA